MQIHAAITKSDLLNLIKAAVDIFVCVSVKITRQNFLLIKNWTEIVKQSAILI